MEEKQKVYMEKLKLKTKTAELEAERTIFLVRIFILQE